MVRENNVLIVKNNLYSLHRGATLADGGLWTTSVGCLLRTCGPLPAAATVDKLPARFALGILASIAEPAEPMEPFTVTPLLDVDAVALEPGGTGTFALVIVLVPLSNKLEKYTTHKA